tara:strand:+ start:744 stop:986 length:243 start_codon:yes stop_codon:yes gene_type:complete
MNTIDHGCTMQLNITGASVENPAHFAMAYTDHDAAKAAAAALRQEQKGQPVTVRTAKRIVKVDGAACTVWIVTERERKVS